MDRSDDELMAACAGADDAAAFATLVARHEARVRLFIARSLPSDIDVVAEARDLAQEVFLEVWQRRRRYEGRGFFVAFLLRLARSRATSRGRALTVRRLFARATSSAPSPSESSSSSSSSSSASSSSRPPDGFEAVLAREEAERLRAAMATLPRATREAITLRFTFGLEPREIAEVLGVDAGAVRVRLHRGLALLRERLDVDDKRLAPRAIDGALDHALDHVVVPHQMSKEGAQ